MSNNIAVKVAVITGASSGLGEATARLLSAQGASIALGARRIDRLQSLADQFDQRWQQSNRGGYRQSLRNIKNFYKELAIPADSVAQAVAYAMSQPEEVDINRDPFRPTRQEL